MKIGVHITDTHWQAGQEHNPAYLLVRDYIKSLRPDILVLGGDQSDWDFLASFNKDKLALVAKSSYQAEFDLINRELDEYWGKAKKIHWINGNHEDRLRQAALSYPPIAELCDLRNRLNIPARYISYHDMDDPPPSFGHLVITHGWYAGKYHASKTLDEYAGCVAYGHVHRFQSHSRRLVARGTEIQAWSIGCLCDLNPSWLRGSPSQWQHGFAVFMVTSDRQFQYFPINVVDGQFIDLKGRLWRV